MEDSPTQPPDVSVSWVRPVLEATAKVGAVFAVAIGAALWFSRPSCACQSDEYRYTTMMKGDLRALQSSQEVYYSDHETYSVSLSELFVTDHLAMGSPTHVFEPSPGVTVILENVTADGFSARAMHAGTPVQCAVFHGDMRPPDSAYQPGEVVCSEP